MYTIMIKVILQNSLRRGLDYHSQPFFFDYCKTDADWKFIDKCAECMQEIFNMRRNAEGGKWTWRQTVIGLTVSRYSDFCKIVGCWVNGDEFYTNQNHEDWRS